MRLCFPPLSANFLVCMYSASDVLLIPVYIVSMYISRYIISISYHMRGEAISVLSLEGRYHKCHKWSSAANERHLWYRPESDIHWYRLDPIMITCLLYMCAFIKVTTYCNINHCPNITIIKIAGQKRYQWHIVFHS
jgi:hypothetical protein